MWPEFLRRRSAAKPNFPDVHSHLLPGLDDGSKSFEDSLAMMMRMRDLGYTSFVTTPHIMQDYYRNSPETILPRLEHVRNELKVRGIDIVISAAAEYYLDESVLRLVEESKPLLTFGNQYLLFETNVFSQPMVMNDFIFKLSVAGIRPVLAHPERYEYLQRDFSKVEEIRDRGALLQINTLSLGGYYGKPAERLARMLVDKGWVSFIGSDCHSVAGAEALESVARDRYFHKVLELPLLNRGLI